MKLQSDAEHQQDDADVGELLGEARVGDEAGRIRSDRHSGKQVADEGRESEPLREVTERQRGGETGRQREDQFHLWH